MIHLVSIAFEQSIAYFLKMPDIKKIAFIRSLQNSAKYTIAICPESFLPDCGVLGQGLCLLNGNSGFGQPTASSRE